MRLPLFLVKILKFEYWTWWAFYLPMLPYWVYWSLRTRSFAYFSVVNPGIELGGFFGESKRDILDKIDKNYLPKYLYVENLTFENLKDILEKEQIEFPIIAKPDVGERGFHVAKITSIEELEEYHRTNTNPYIIQEYISFEVELGVLYNKMPNSTKGKVTSLTGKEFLSVVGDGVSPVAKLMEKDPRSQMQIPRLWEEKKDLMNLIPQKDEKILLEPIGNHCKGTRFINYNHFINEDVHQVFDKIAESIDGFYYGRFDLRVKSIEDLYEGKNIKILELNGVSSEPGHIYDISYTVFRAYRDLIRHWRIIGKIAIENIKNGIKPVPFSVIIKTYWKHFTVSVKK
jgi:hypothetical protein